MPGSASGGVAGENLPCAEQTARFFMHLARSAGAANFFVLTLCQSQRIQELDGAMPDNRDRAEYQKDNPCI